MRLSFLIPAPTRRTGRVVWPLLCATLILLNACATIPPPERKSVDPETLAASQPPPPAPATPAPEPPAPPPPTVTPDPVHDIIADLLPPDALPAPTPETIDLDPGAIIAGYEARENIRAATADEYTLRLGDIIEINTPANGMRREIIIPPDGIIAYFFIDQLAVLGKTPDEIRLAVAERLAPDQSDQQVTVRVIRFAGNGATAIGAVNRPGAKLFTPGNRLTQLLLKAGGVRMQPQLPGQSKAKPRKAILFRQNHGQSIDLELLEKNDPTTDLEIEPGDLLFVPYPPTNQVWVLGEVSLPLVIQVNGKLTLAGAIAAAGGLKDSAVADEVLIIRGSLEQPTLIRLDLRTAQNELAVGDIVYVPEQHDMAREELVSRIAWRLSSLGDHP